MTTLPTPFQHRIGETRRRSVERVDDMSAKDTTVSGRSPIDGLGECLIDVVFPVAFGRRPNFTFGAELDDTTLAVIQGQYPRVSAFIVGWTVVSRVPGAFDGYFTGAEIAVVIEGNQQQKSWLHWSFHAPAIRNPVKITDDLTATI